MAQSGNSKTPRDILRIFFRRKSLFLLTAGLCAIIILLAAHKLPLKYTGTTKFERRTDPAVEQDRRRGSESFESSKLTLDHELAGRTAVEKVVEELDLDRGLARDENGRLTEEGVKARDDLIRNIQENISVRWEVKSANIDLVAVSVVNSDPELARAIPNKLVSNYINAFSERIIRRLKASEEFLSRQVNSAEMELKTILDEKIQFETEHKGFSTSPGKLQEQADEYRLELDTMRRQRDIASQKLARLTGMVQEIRQENEGDKPTEVVMGPNPALRELQAELKDWKGQLDQALTIDHMTENHPRVKTMRSKIQSIQQEIDETPEKIILSEVYASGGEERPNPYAAEVAACKAEIGTMERDIERLQKRLDEKTDLLANIGPIIREYEDILQRMEQQEKEVERYRIRLDGVEMALAAEAAKRSTHVETIEPAQEQHRPSSPSLLMILGATAVGSLGIAGALVFLTSMIDRSITTVDEAVEHYDLPVHGVIGEIVTPEKRTLRTILRWVIAPTVALVLLVCIAGAVLSIVIWLQYPDQFQTWSQMPLTFVLNLGKVSG